MARGGGWNFAVVYPRGGGCASSGRDGCLERGSAAGRSVSVYGYAAGACTASSVMVMRARFMGCLCLVMGQAFMFLMIDRPGGLVDNASVPSNPIQSP